jgi:hypothetical protein
MARISVIFIHSSKLYPVTLIRPGTFFGTLAGNVFGALDRYDGPKDRQPIIPNQNPTYQTYILGGDFWVIRS